MRSLSLLITFLCTVAVAQVGSDLSQEFFRRDGIKLTAQQGGVINYMRAIQFPLEKILELETLNDVEQSFLFKDRYGIVCFGQISLQNLRCKSVLGVTSQEFSAETLNLSPLHGSSSPLAQEFLARESIQLDPKTKDIVDFLKRIKYPVETLVEIEAMKDLSQSFFARDRNNIVCFGSVVGEMVRCKNEIGITGVTFTGDSD